jgi:hypothetical protein
MKPFLLTVLLLLAGSTLFTPLSHAQRFEGTLSTGYLGFGKGASQFDIGPGIFYQPMPSWGWLQLGGELTYQKLAERGGSTKNMLVMAGPVFNLSGSVLSDAYYISVGVSYKSGSSDLADPTAESANGIGTYVMFGRRITLASTWSFRPSIGLAAGGIVFRPFAVSYRF